MPERIRQEESQDPDHGAPEPREGASQDSGKRATPPSDEGGLLDFIRKSQAEEAAPEPEKKAAAVNQHKSGPPKTAPKTFNDPTEDFEQEPAPAQKPEEKIEPDSEIPKGLGVRGEADWKKMRDTVRTEKAERIKETQTRVQREAEFEQYKAQFNKEEIDRLRTEHADLQKRLRVTAVEKDPDFVRQYEGSRKTVLDMAKTLGGENGDKLAEVLSMPDSKHKREQLNAILEDMPISERSEIGAISLELKKLDGWKANRIANADAEFKSMQERQQNDRTARSAAAMRDFEGLITRWADPEKGLAVLQDREGDADWNAMVARAKDEARKTFSGQVPAKDWPLNALKAATWKPLVQHIQRQANREAELTAEIARLKSSQPGPGGSPKDDAVEDEANMGLVEKVMRDARKNGYIV